MPYLCKALGIPKGQYVKKVVITADVRDVVRVEVQRFMPEHHLKHICEVLAWPS